MNTRFFAFSGLLFVIAEGVCKQRRERQKIITIATKRNFTVKFSPLAMSPKQSMSYISVSSFEEERISKTSNDIFFLETQSPISLTGRKLCSIESASAKNPHRTVYVLLDTEEKKIHLPLR